MLSTKKWTKITHRTRAELHAYYADTVVKSRMEHLAY